MDILHFLRSLASSKASFEHMQFAGKVTIFDIFMALCIDVCMYVCMYICVTLFHCRNTTCYPLQTVIQLHLTTLGYTLCTSHSTMRGRRCGELRWLAPRSIPTWGQITWDVVLSTKEFRLGPTVEVEKFTGLNLRGFNPTEVFAEILSCCLSQKCLLLKSDAYIHGKTFTVLLKTTKTMKV